MLFVTKTAPNRYLAENSSKKIMIISQLYLISFEDLFFFELVIYLSLHPHSRSFWLLLYYSVFAVFNFYFICSKSSARQKIKLGLILYLTLWFYKLLCRVKTACTSVLKGCQFHVTGATDGISITRENPNWLNPCLVRPFWLARPQN